MSTFEYRPAMIPTKASAIDVWRLSADEIRCALLIAIANGTIKPSGAPAAAKHMWEAMEFLMEKRLAQDSDGLASLAALRSLSSSSQIAS